VVKAYPDSEQGGRIISTFLTQIDERLADSPTVDAWTQWTDFFQANESLFDAVKKDEWALRAESFCFDDIDEIIRNADTASEAQQWYDQLSNVAEGWGISLESHSDKFRERLEELERMEESAANSNEDWGGPVPTERLSGDDAEIDRLFNSLNEHE
jgi:hypothetical protein